MQLKIKTFGKRFNVATYKQVKKTKASKTSLKKKTRMSSSPGQIWLERCTSFLPPMMCRVKIKFDAGDGTSIVQWEHNDTPHHLATGTKGSEPEPEPEAETDACGIYRYVNEWLDMKHSDIEGLAFMCAKANELDNQRRRSFASCNRIAKVGLTLYDTVGREHCTVLVLETDLNDDGKWCWSQGRDTDFDRPCLRMPMQTKLVMTNLYEHADPVNCFGIFGYDS